MYSGENFSKTILYYEIFFIVVKLDNSLKKFFDIPNAF